MSKPLRYLLRLAAFVVLGGFLPACASGFSAIEKVSDGTYLVTHYQEGFASVTSYMLLCAAKQTKMVCRSVVSQSSSPEGAPVGVRTQPATPSRTSAAIAPPDPARSRAPAGW